jgi:hypothetical protein
MRPLLSASERRVAPVCDCSSPSTRGAGRRWSSRTRSHTAAVSDLDRQIACDTGVGTAEIQSDPRQARWVMNLNASGPPHATLFQRRSSDLACWRRLCCGVGVV